MNHALTTSVADMVSQARQAIDEVAAVDAVTLLDDPQVQFVDLRDVRERQRSGYIPGSFHCPRGMLEFWVDPESPYYKPVFGEDRRFVFYCASGWRSALSVATLGQMGFARASHVHDGFSGWLAADGPVASDG